MPSPIITTPAMSPTTAIARFGARSATKPARIATTPRTSVMYPSLPSTPFAEADTSPTRTSAHVRNEPIAASAPPINSRMAPIGARRVVEVSMDPPSSEALILPSRVGADQPYAAYPSRPRCTGGATDGDRSRLRHGGRPGERRVEDRARRHHVLLLLEGMLRGLRRGPRRLRRLTPQVVRGA